MNSEKCQPLVSIIIPVYNGAEYMKQAIDSAIAQTYSNIEILVINDGSNDNGETERIALSYGDKISYFEKENGGVSSALNLGIKAMRGEYFSWLSHDDVYTPEKIEKQVEALLAQKNDKCVAYCQTRFIDENSNMLIKNKKKHETGLLDWKKAVRFVTDNSPNGCAFLIPKSAFEETGLFDESLRYSQDRLMWWNIFLRQYSLLITDEEGVLSRIHDKQVSNTQRHLYCHDAKYISEIMIKRFAEISTIDDNQLYYYAKREAKHGCSFVSDRCVQIANQKNLFSFVQKINLLYFKSYSHIRPALRKYYYKMLKVKSKLLQKG